MSTATLKPLCRHASTRRAGRRTTRVAVLVARADASQAASGPALVVGAAGVAEHEVAAADEGRVREDRDIGRAVPVGPVSHDVDRVVLARVVVPVVVVLEGREPVGVAGLVHDHGHQAAEVA
jgi:hypothetical protein